MNPIAPARSPLAISILALGIGFAGLCAAAQPQVTVSYRDLAISTPQGAMVLYQRIRFAADEACSYLDHGDLSSKVHKSTCVDGAIANAVMHVGEPQLFSVYDSNHRAPLPASLADSSIAGR